MTPNEAAPRLHDASAAHQAIHEPVPQVPIVVDVIIGRGWAGTPLEEEAMPRVCTVCQHPERDTIDQTLVRGVAYRGVARQFGVSKDALGRHFEDHLPALLVKGHDAAEATQADRLLGDVRELRETAYRLLLAAEAAGDLRTALLGVREARGFLELLAKLSGELDERPQLNLLIAPEWLQMRAVLLAALAPYPEARAAVATRLVALHAGTLAGQEVTS